jgi:hypothetical protein
MPEVEGMAAPPTAREFLRALRTNWLYAMAGVLSVAAWFTSVLLPGIAAPKILGVASMSGFVLAAYGLWAAERGARIEAEKTVDSKRPRIVPELVYATASPHSLEFYLTNVGEWAAREVSVSSLGPAGYSHATFDMVPVLNGGGARAKLNARFSGGAHEHSLDEVLGTADVVRFIGARRAQLAAGEGDQPAERAKEQLPVTISYFDVHPGREFVEQFMIEFVEPASRIPNDGVWVIRAVRS